MSHDYLPQLTMKEIYTIMFESRNRLVLAAESMSAHGYPSFTTELRKIHRQLDKLWNEWYEVMQR